MLLLLLLLGLRSPRHVSHPHWDPDHHSWWHTGPPDSLHLESSGTAKEELSWMALEIFHVPMCLLFGLTYTLHWEYPQQLKYTVDFIQRMGKKKRKKRRKEGTVFIYSLIFCGREPYHTFRLLNGFMFIRRNMNYFPLAFLFPFVLMPTWLRWYWLSASGSLASYLRLNICWKSISSAVLNEEFKSEHSGGGLQLHIQLK